MNLRWIITVGCCILYLVSEANFSDLELYFAERKHLLTLWLLFRYCWEWLRWALETSEREKCWDLRVAIEECFSSMVYVILLFKDFKTSTTLGVYPNIYFIASLISNFSVTKALTKAIRTTLSTLRWWLLTCFFLLLKLLAFVWKIYFS